MNKKVLSLLVVEDNPSDFLIIEQMLRSVGEPAFTILHASNCETAESLLLNNSFDLILLDLMLPDSEGIDSFFRIKSSSKQQPILILSGVKDSELALKAVQNGAQDYLMKGDFDDKWLVKSIQYAVERHRLETEALQKDQLYRHLFEENPLAYFIWNPFDKSILYANKAATEKYGYTDQEWQKLSFDQLFEQSDNLSKVLKVEEPNELIKNFRKDHSILYVKLKNFPYEFQGKKVTLSIIEDKTNDKTKEAELSFQAEILSHVRDVVIVTDHNHKIVFWNVGAEEILGYQADEVKGKKISQLVADIYADELETFSRDSMNGADQKRLFGFVSKNVNLHLLDLHSSPMRNNSHMRGAVHVAKDVTTSNKLIESQRETVATLNTLFNNVEQSVFLLDALGKIRSFNASATKYAVQFLGREMKLYDNFIDLFSSNISQLVKEKVQESFFKKSSLQFDVEIKFASNKSHWFILQLNPMKTDDDEIIGLCVGMINITDKKVNEERLYKQFKEIEDANKQLDQFVYAASHDLRAPLNSVLGLINLSKLEEPTSSVVEYLDLMEKSINQLDELIKDFLNYSRNQRMGDEYAPIKLKKLVNNLIDNLRFTDKADQIDWQIEIEPDFEFNSDEPRFKMALSNLLSNAIRYHDYGKKDKLFVRIKAENIDGKTSISMTDNGIGIEASKQDHLFEMFYRASNRPGGTGLGLYLVKQIIEKLGGTISFTSNFGVGSTFTIDFNAQLGA